MITFQIEKLAPIWHEIFPMANEHWSETEDYRNGEGFNPDALRYFQFNGMPSGAGDLPFYTMFTARDAGRLVGYAGCYLARSMHTQKTICTEDTYFLLPDYRKGRNALEFYKFIERCCQEAGVIGMGMTAKNATSVGVILKYLGFGLVSGNYYKHLSYNSVSPQQGIALTDGRADSTDTATVKELSNERTHAAA